MINDKLVIYKLVTSDENYVPELRPKRTSNPSLTARP